MSKQKPLVFMDTLPLPSSDAAPAMFILPFQMEWMDENGFLTGLLDHITDNLEQYRLASGRGFRQAGVYLGEARRYASQSSSKQRTRALAFEAGVGPYGYPYVDQMLPDGQAAEITTTRITVYGSYTAPGSKVDHVYYRTRFEDGRLEWVKALHAGMVRRPVEGNPLDIDGLSHAFAKILKPLWCKAEQFQRIMTGRGSEPINEHRAWEAAIKQTWLSDWASVRAMKEANDHRATPRLKQAYVEFLEELNGGQQLDARGWVQRLTRDYQLDKNEMIRAKPARSA